MSTARPAVARQRPWRAVLLAVALLTLLIAAGVWYAANSLLAGLCSSTEITRLTAPDGRHDAVLFERNCGATTDFATHVSVLPVGAPLANAAGNAFAAEAGDASSRAPWGGPVVDLVWEPNSALAIRHDAAAEVFHAAEAVNDVAIRIEAQP